MQYTFEDLVKFIGERSDVRSLNKFETSTVLRHYAQIPWPDQTSPSNRQSIIAYRVNDYKRLETRDVKAMLLLFYAKNFCKNYKELKDALASEAFLKLEIEAVLKLANTLRCSNDIGNTTALEMVNYFFPKDDPQAVFVEDARAANAIQLMSDALHFDIASQRYYQSDSGFVTIHRKNGKHLRAHRHNIVYDLGFRCRRTNNWYFSADYTRIQDYDGYDTCLEVNAERLHLWNSDGCYHYDEVEPADARSYAENMDDDDEYLPGYHSRKRPSWWSSAQGIGMELECDSDEPIKLAKSLPPDILGEDDGSLNEDGIELIGGPYTCKQYQELKTPWNGVLDTIHEIGGKGYEAGEGYGIHLSVSRTLFSTLHAAKFIVFFNQQDALCKLIAQRDTIYSGGYGTRGKVKSTVEKKVDYTSYDEKKKKFTKNKFEVATGKYEAVHADNRRLEVRIFRSNIRWERILKNIEFVQAVFDFTRDASIDVVATEKGTDLFLQWLAKQNDFKTLKEFLYEEKNRSRKSHQILEVFTFKPKEPKK